MGINIYNIKRWTRMLTGKSIYHVNQGLGKAIKKGGYYNDLTQKVLLGEKNLDENGIPFLEHEDGNHIQMPTMIFQYGLGAFDLWLLKNKKDYLDKAILCAEWAIEHQKDDGSWSTFFYVYPDAPYSAMPQGEAISLLLRVYQETGEDKWIVAAKKAVEFMLTDVKAGGVAKRDNNKLYLLEYTHLPIVLNGWIFAAWGLYDAGEFWDEYKEEFNKTVYTMVETLPKFDNGYWSLYDLGGMITSPFYHNLHIAQMEAMYMITNNSVFLNYQEIFKNYSDKWFNEKKAFIVKVFQKIKE